MEAKNHPKVGFGVYVKNSKNEFLFLKRKGSHGEGDWCSPGGHLEMGESFEAGAKREAMEEAGIEIKNIKVIGVTNDIFSKEKHYITIGMSAEIKSGEKPKLMEPQTMDKIGWFKLNNLPRPLFMTMRHLMEQNCDCFCGSEKKFRKCHGAE